MLGIKALADLGARWIDRAVERVPRLTEAMLGRQEGALRELLRQFREGDVERALRHALPLGGDGGRGGVPSADGKLPTVDPTYSLQSLLGSGRGAERDLVRRLRRPGRAGPRVPQGRRGGRAPGRLPPGRLHPRQAPERLRDRRPPARPGRPAPRRRVPLPGPAQGHPGRRPGLRGGRRGRPGPAALPPGRLHAEAGDLLRRIGEEDAAVAEYLLAADAPGRRPEHGALAAGDLLRDRARRPDLALDYYARGWARSARRPTPCACASGWPRSSPTGARPAALLELVDEADAPAPAARPRRPGRRVLQRAGPPGRPRGAGRGPRRPPRPGPDGPGRQAPRRRSRRRGRPGPLASAYFGRNQAWSADLVGDATHALKAAFEPRPSGGGCARLVVGPTRGASPGGSRSTAGSSRPPATRRRPARSSSASRGAGLPVRRRPGRGRLPLRGAAARSPRWRSTPRAGRWCCSSARGRARGGWSTSTGSPRARAAGPGRPG